MEEAKKAAEAEFEHISKVAKQEVCVPCHIPFVDCVGACDMFFFLFFLFFSQIARLQGARVEMLRQALVQWCEKQLVTAKENADQFNQHLQALRGMS